MNTLPKEITYHPVPYVALVGLDLATPSCTAVWNAFTLNRSPDRPLMYYKYLPIEHPFQPTKTKKTYDHYIPSGILKTSWIGKHLFEIPSVAVVFDQANWETLQASDIRNKCIERVTYVRNSLHGRQTKIVLVLLQSNSLALTDDSIYKEYAAKLCAECEINTKSFFIIPINETELISGYVLRIEQVLSELAKNYYLNICKSVKSHKDQLNKSSQIFLYIRHEFKLGFFHEIRQIHNTALGHYKNAYLSLMEIRTSSMNIFEVKSIASLLNYKICRLCFYLNIPMDAIAQYRKHIEIFQNKHSSVQIKFEHAGWLSDQFAIFAELFDLAVSSFNLSPSSSQNPGVYYYEAAVHMTERRELAKCNDLHIDQLNADELATLNTIINSQHKEFFGQFAWKNDLPEADRIGFVLKALKYNECQTDHTKLLISLYGHVLNQVHKFKKPRFMRYIMFLIGKEYFYLANYEEALSYLCNVSHFMREEKWDEVYFQVIKLTLASAYLSCDLNNFIKFSFEQMCDKSMSDDQKRHILSSALSFLNLQVTTLQTIENKWPAMVDGQQVSGRWSEVLAKWLQKDSQKEISISLDRESTFLDCKLYFAANEYSIGQTVRLTVAIYSTLPLEITNVTLQLKFVKPYYDQFCMLDSRNVFTLRPNTVNSHSFECKPLLEDIGKEIRVSEVILKLGAKISISFHWSLLKQHRSLLPLPYSTKSENMEFRKIPERFYTKILEHESNLQVKVDTEVENIFVQERAICKLLLINKESYPISNVQMSLQLCSFDDKQDSQFVWYIVHDGQLCPIEASFLIVNRLESNQSYESECILQVFSTGIKKVNFTFRYDLMLGDNNVQSIRAQKQTCHQLNCVEPFVVSSTICNLASNDTAQIRVSEPFKLHISVGSSTLENSKNNSIKLIQLGTKLAENCQLVSHQLTNRYPVQLSADVPLRECYLLSCTTESASPNPLGHCWLQWIRQRSESSSSSTSNSINYQLLVNETICPLPSTAISASLIFVQLTLPDICYARSAFMARYIIHNRLDMDVIVEISMGMSDCFMISGNKLIKASIKAQLFIEQTYILFPLLCGELILPQLGITVHIPGRHAIPVDSINQMITSSVKVLPQLRSIS